jgi:nucleotide-binding universal stress UspA family protein
MKMLIYVGDLITDMQAIFLGGLVAKKIKSSITLLHIASKERQKKKERKTGENILNLAKEKLGDLDVSTRFRRGKVAEKILSQVDEGKYELVVISATRLGGYPRNLSVSRKILTQMPCSVLIAKNPKASISRILLLTGGISTSEAVVNMGAKFASALNARITLLHIASNVPSMYTGLETIEETLEELLQTNTPTAKHLRWCAKVLRDHDVSSEIKLKHGELLFEILREIDKEDYDLVVIGASGVSAGLQEWVMGNVTKDLIDLTGIPIMVINQAHAQKIKDITP